jgi:hypothetical protein
MRWIVRFSSSDDGLLHVARFYCACRRMESAWLRAANPAAAIATAPPAAAHRRYFMERIRFPHGCGQWPILERIPMKWNRCKWQPGGSSCTDLFDLDHSAISFRGTVAMNRMSVERRRFLRVCPARRWPFSPAGPVERKPAWARTSVLPMRTRDDRSHRTSSGSATNSQFDTNQRWSGAKSNALRSIETARVHHPLRDRGRPNRALDLSPA